MTSLSEQLKRLAVAQTSRLQSDKKRASLLFSSEEAAKLDRETIFGIGINGFEELVQLNSRFADFGDFLFSEKNVSYERSVQTREANESLDRQLKLFLLRLSPYFPLKSAQKALEWLIYRYHIHEYNVSDVIRCILPYHDTNLFARFLQILVIPESDPLWFWLIIAQKSGMPISRLTVIKHVNADLNFVNFLCSTVSELQLAALEPSKFQVWFSFLASTLITAIASTPSVSDAYMTLITPFLLNAFKSKSDEIQLCSYMIVCQIAKKTQLLSPVVNDFLSSVLLKVREATFSEALATAIVLCQTQTCVHNLALDQKILKILSGPFRTYFLRELTLLDQATDCTEFLRLFITLLIEIVSDVQSPIRRQTAGEMLSSCINGFQLNDTVATELISQFISGFVRFRENFESLTDEDSQLWADVCGRLSRRNPAAFDVAVRSSVKRDKTHAEIIRQLVAMSHAKPKVCEGDAQIFLGLHHPNSEIRLLSAHQLFESYSGKGSMTKEELIVHRDFIVESFNTIDVPLIKLFVKNFQAVFEILGEDLLLESLVKLFQTAPNSTTDIGKREKIKKVTDKLIDKFCTLTPVSYETAAKTVCFCLSRFLISTEDEIRTAKLLLTHPALKKCGLAEHLSKEFIQLLETSEMNDDTFSEMNDSVTDAIAAWMTEHRQFDHERAGTLKWAKDLRLMVISALALMKCAALIDQKRCKTEVLSYLKYMLDEMNKFEKATMKCDLVQLLGGNVIDKQFVFSVCQSATVNLISEEFCLLLRWNFLKQRNLKSVLKGKWANSEPDAIDELLGIFKDLVDLIERHSHEKKKFQTVLEKFLQVFLSDLPSLVKVTLFSVVSEKWDVTVKSYLVKILQIAVGAVDLLLLRETLTDDSLLITLLVLLLGNESVKLRNLGADCLQSLSDRLAERHSEILFFESFVAFLQPFQQELRSDGYQLCQILTKISIDSAATGNTKTPKATGRRISRFKTSVENEGKVLGNVGDTVLNLFRLSVADETPMEVSVALLRQLNKIHGWNVLDICHARVREQMKGKTAISPMEEEMIKLLLGKYSPAIASMITEESDVFVTLREVLRHLGSLPWGQRQLGLSQITNELFSRLSLSVQKEIVVILIEEHFKCSIELTETAVAIKAILTSVTLDSKLVVSLLPAQKIGLETTEKKTKRLKSIGSAIAGISDTELKRVRLILEITLANFPSGDFSVLVPIMFHILKIFIESSLESSIQLVLANLAELGEKAIAVGRSIHEEDFSLELIVQCIREFTSSKIHQFCFRLLTVGAILFKEYLLHHVLSIFTFMGSSLMRQDDSYSFHVIFRTLDTVVPAVVMASSKGNRSGNIDKTVVEIFQIFVDSLPHIPDHRRLPLFRQLIAAASGGVSRQQLNTDQNENMEEFLWVLVALMLVRSVTSGRKSDEDMEEEVAESEMDFAFNLQFSYIPEVQLTVLQKLLHYILSLPEKQSAGAKPTKSSPEELLFDVRLHTEKQLRHFRYVVVKHVYMSLQNAGFVSQLAELCPEEFEAIEVRFQHLMEECINGIHFAKTKIGAGASLNESELAFWRSFLHKNQQSLEKVNLLLPTTTGLKALHGLLQRPDWVLKRCSLEVLNTKLLQNPTPFQKSHIPQLIEIVGLLGDWLPSDQTGKSSDEIDLLQLGLYSLKLLARVTSSFDQEPFKQLLAKVVGFVHKWDSWTSLLLSNAVLCLAELVDTLGSETLDQMPVYVPDLLHILKSARNNDNEELLLLSCLAGLVKVVETLASFLSPYLPEIVEQGCLIFGSIDSFGQFQTPISNRLESLQSQLAAVPGRVLIPAIAENFFSMSGVHPQYLTFSFKILSEHFGKFSAEEVMQCSSALTPFFLSALDLRTQVALTTVTAVEDSTIEAFTSYAMKLSENSFRPVMFKLCEWASRDSEKPDRLIVLFKLCERLAEKLRSLFTLFAGQLLKLGAECLDKTNLTKTETLLFPGKKAKSKSNELIIGIFDCFSKCFQHDNDKFINRERFDMLLNPIVDQLDNIKIKIYEDRVVGHFIPCLISLALAVKDDSAWKTLNYQLLLKTRDKSAKIRFSALLSAENLYERLGDEFTPLVSETVPFLAELLEDESEEVESQCRKVIIVIEKILGESLQQYF